MSVIALILILLFLAVLYWLVNYKFPTPSPIKLLINIVLIITAVILVLNALGIWEQVRGVQVPHV